MVGFEPVAQQTPLTVTDAPPSELILPPDIAVVDVIEVTAVVVNEGTTNWLVVNVTSFP
jgi:hypothetical protein